MIKILIVNIYAPNKNQDNFFQRLKETLNNLEYQDCCILGDFNAVFDRVMDKSTSNKKNKSGVLLPKCFLQMAEELNLIVAWRMINPMVKDYTYYSIQYQSWSQINACWLSPELAKELKDAKILPGTFADHRPLWISLNDYPKRRQWRLNKRMLQSETFVQSAKKEMDNFFVQNMGKGTSMLTVWDVSKAFFRGLAISYSAQQKKEKSLKLKLLKEEMKREENKLTTNPSVKQIVKINYIQHQINLLLTEDLEKEIIC